MFTGIVECQVSVSRVVREDSRCVRLSVKLGSPAEDLSIGSSVAINGVCLTITEVNGDELSFDIMLETLNRTNLSMLSAGDMVNFERSLRAGEPIEGHIVLGHVDFVGEVREVRELADGSREMWIKTPREYAVYLAPKGAVAVDGVSLTIVDVQDEAFMVALIPHTLEVTTLGRKKPGDKLNIEIDVIARYVYNAVKAIMDKSRGD